MPHVFVISSHGSMPVVDDEFELPKFNHFSETPVVKKPVSKKTVDKTHVVKKTVSKKTVDKKPVVKKTVSKKTGTAATPSAGLFAAPAPSAGLFAAPAPSAELFVTKAPAELFVTKAPAELFVTKAPAELFAAPAPSAKLFATKAPAELFVTKAPAGLFATKAPAGLFAAKGSSATDAAKGSADLFSAKGPSAADAAKGPSSLPSAAFSVGMGVKPTFKKPVSFEAPLDIFTTAKCGRPFCSSLLCDPPYVDLVRYLSERPHAKGTVTKDEVRKIIEDAMVHIRGEPRHAMALTKAENRIRCHKKGSNMTELFLFGPSVELPIIESVTMVDMETGEILDVHEMFGLVEKKVVRRTSSNTVLDAEDLMEGLQAKAAAELELKELLKMPDVNPFYVDMKREHIQTIDATIAGELKESKFEYSPELKKKYGERVKLSDLLKIGIENGLVVPGDDSLVMYTCRVPDKRVMQFTIPSPRGYDSEGSVGGGSNPHNAVKFKSNAKAKAKTKAKTKTKTCKRRR